MRYSLIAALLITMPCWSQTTTTGQAETTGPCSPAVSGSSNTFTINCGIGKEQGAALLKIVNKILANQLDANAVMSKLNELEDVMKSSVVRSRVMSPKKLEEFSSALGTANGSLTVVPCAYREDVLPLAKQLCTAGETAKWYSHCIGIDSINPRPTATGLECYTSDWHRADASAFKSAMKNVGLECRYKTHQYVHQGASFDGVNGITVLIGSPVKTNIEQREINEDEEWMIKGYLQKKAFPSTTKVTVLSCCGDESTSFGKRLVEVLQGRADVDHDSPSPSLYSDSRGNDLEIHVHPDSDLKAEGLTLASALKLALGLKIKAEYDPGMPIDRIVVWVFPMKQD